MNPSAVSHPLAHRDGHSQPANYLMPDKRVVSLALLSDPSAQNKLVVASAGANFVILPEDNKGDHPLRENTVRGCTSPRRRMRLHRNPNKLHSWVSAYGMQDEYVFS